MRRVAWPAVVGVSVVFAGSALAQTAASPTDESADAPLDDPAELPDFSVRNEPTPDTRVRGALIGPQASSRLDAIGSRGEKADGSLSVSAGERLPTEWDTKVGVDVAAPAPSPHPLASQTRTAAAPAALGLDKATIDARVDPNADQGRLCRSATAVADVAERICGDAVARQPDRRRRSGKCIAGGTCRRHARLLRRRRGAARISQCDALGWRKNVVHRRPAAALGQRRAESVRYAAHFHRFDQPAPDWRDRSRHHGGAKRSW